MNGDGTCVPSGSSGDEGGVDSGGVAKEMTVAWLMTFLASYVCRGVTQV